MARAGCEKCNRCEYGVRILLGGEGRVSGRECSGWKHEVVTIQL